MDLRIISEHKYICGRAKEESRKGYNETLSFTYINSLSHFSSQFLPWLSGDKASELRPRRDWRGYTRK